MKRKFSFQLKLEQAFWLIEGCWKEQILALGCAANCNLLPAILCSFSHFCFLNENNLFHSAFSMLHLSTQKWWCPKYFVTFQMVFHMAVVPANGHFFPNIRKQVDCSRAAHLITLTCFSFQISSWIKSSNGVLSSYTEPGSSLFEAEEVLNKHMELSKHTQVSLTSHKNKWEPLAFNFKWRFIY